MKTSHLISFSISFALAVAGIVAGVLLINTLPDQIPTHFNFYGTPDAWVAKSFLSVFLMPLLELAIFALFLLIYRHPQYSSWPTTLILMTVEESKREKVFEVLRSMLVWIMLVLAVFFSYLQFVIFSTANGRVTGVNQYAMFAFLGAILILLVYFNARMFTTIRKLTRK